MARNLAELVRGKIPVIFDNPINGNNIELIEVPLAIPEKLNQRIREQWVRELERRAKTLGKNSEIKPFQTPAGETTTLYLNGNPILYPGPSLSLQDIEIKEKVRLYVSQIDYSYFKALQDPVIADMNKKNGKNLITPFFAGAFPITLDKEIALTVRGENAGAYPNTLWGVGGQLEFPKQSLQDFLADELLDELLIPTSDYDSNNFQFTGMVENPESIGLVGWLPVNLTSEEIRQRVHGREIEKRPVDAIDIVFAPADALGLFDYMTRRVQYSLLCNSGFEAMYLFGRQNFGEEWASELLQKLD